MIIRSLVAQGVEGQPSLLDELTDVIEEYEFDRLDVAVAYATDSGLTALKSITGEWPELTRWVVGLDDAITQPTAIEKLTLLEDVEIRLARLLPQRRFHPKLYCYWSSKNPAACIAAIGSANMTEYGLKRNGEIAVLLEAESEEDTDQLKQAWESLNSLGTDIDDVDLVEYREAYDRVRKARRRIKFKDDLPETPEAEEGNSFQSQIVEGAPNFWLEIGSAVGGRELELPKAVLPFFDVPSYAHESLRSFILPNGIEVTLRLIDRAQNGMWRLEFSADSIEAICNRRSFRQLDGTARSDLILHLQREGDALRAQTVLVDSDQAVLLVQRSADDGFQDSTVGAGSRNYGFF